MFKFICKDFWTHAFGRQIDNLKTNHRGVYQLQIQEFTWAARFAADASMPDNANMTILVPYPCAFGPILYIFSIWHILADYYEVPSQIWVLNAR